MSKLLRRLKRIFFGILILIGLSFLWPHGPNFGQMGRERDDVLNENQDRLTIGVSWSSEQRGPELVNGIRLAISHIYEMGLINHMPIQLIIRDDQGETEKTQAIARDFADMKHMSAVIGYSNDPQAAAASVVFQAAKLLQIVVGAPSTELTRRDQPYLIRTLPSARELALKMAVATGQAPVDFAVITEKSGYREEFAETFAINQIQKGGKRVYNRSYPSELKPNFLRTSYEIQSLDVDLILFAGEAKDAGLFIKQARLIGITSPIICSCSDTDTLAKILGANMQNITLPTFYDPSSNSKENVRFVKAYKKRFNKVPNEWAAQGYDAMFILAHAVAKSRSVNPLDLAWSIRYMPEIQGVAQKFVFSPHGDLIDKASTSQRK